MVVSVLIWGRGDNFIVRVGVVGKDDIELKFILFIKFIYRLIKYKKKIYSRKVGKKEILVLLYL